MKFDFEAVNERHFTILLKSFIANGYTFALRIYAKKGDAEDRARVAKLAGRNAGFNPVTKELYPTGISIPLRLDIYRLTGNQESLAYHKEVAQMGLESGGADYASKLIGGTALEPGYYRGRVEALRDIPELIDTHIEFAMYIRVL